MSIHQGSASTGTGVRELEIGGPQDRESTKRGRNMRTGA